MMQQPSYISRLVMNNSINYEDHWPVKLKQQKSLQLLIASGLENSSPVIQLKRNGTQQHKAMIGASITAYPSV
jgi:hypothetical protein